MTLLPLLIRGKVKFYYDRNNWLERLKVVNEEYEQKVQRYYQYNTDGIEILSRLSWKSKNRSNFILDLDEDPDYPYPDPIPYYRRAIHSFKDGSQLYYQLPKKYCYSSGLNNPNGYK
jgi:hypothetical protein